MIVFCHLLNDTSGSPMVLRQAIRALAPAGEDAVLFVGSQGRGALETAGVPIQRYWYRRSGARIVTLFTYLASQLFLYRALVRARLPADAPPLSAHGKAYSTQVEAAIARGLARSPEARYQRAGDFADEFVAAIDAPVVHLVGHSLGGLVILSMLANRPDEHIGRIVLLGSPCGGSHCARVLLGIPFLRPLVGRSLREWLERPCLPPPPEIEIGVLAGDSGFGLGRLIPGLARPNDGVVSLDETRLDTARDSIVLPIGHSKMLVSPACLAQIVAFVRSGSFAH